MMAAIVVRLCTYALLLALGPTSAVMAAPTPAHPPVVQVLHNSFVSAEKFQHLQSFAQRQGVRLRHLNVEDCTPKALQLAVNEADLLVLDVPRPNDREMVTQRLHQVLPLAARPRITIGGGRPDWEEIGRAHD